MCYFRTSSSPSSKLISGPYTFAGHPVEDFATITVHFQFDPSNWSHSSWINSGFLAGVAIVLVQKQLTKSDDVIELKSSLTSINETEDFSSSYDADDYYTEIEIIEPDVTRMKSKSKTVKKGMDEFSIEYFDPKRSPRFDRLERPFLFWDRLQSLYCPITYFGPATFRPTFLTFQPLT